jgi:hypothetical protein
MSSSNSMVDAVGPTSSAPRGPAIDVIFKLSDERCRTHWHAPQAARHRHRLQTRWWMLPDPPIVPPRGPSIDVASNSVVDIVGPTGSAPHGARHRCHLQTRWRMLPDPPAAPPRGPHHLRHLQTQWRTLLDPSVAPPRGAAIDVISNWVVDAARPADSAPKGPAINVVFKLIGRRCWTCRQCPLGARHRRRLQTWWWTLLDPPAAPPRGPTNDVISNSVVDATGPTGNAP